MTTPTPESVKALADGLTAKQKAAMLTLAPNTSYPYDYLDGRMRMNLFKAQLVASSGVNKPITMRLTALGILVQVRLVASMHKPDGTEALQTREQMLAGLSKPAMDDALVEKVARAIATSLAHQDGYEGDEPWPLEPDGTIAFLDQADPNMLMVARAVLAIPDLRLAGVKEGLEMAAAYLDGQGGLIPGATVFAPLVSGNNQPCMSGDGRDRLASHKRRHFDDATHALATAIRSLGPRP